MAKCVAPGHLKIKDDSSGPHHKKANSDVKSKNKKSPQPEALLKEDIYVEPFHDYKNCLEKERAARMMGMGLAIEKEDIYVEPFHDYKNCLEKERAARMMGMRLAIENEFLQMENYFQEEDYTPRIMEELKDLELEPDESPFVLG